MAKNVFSRGKSLLAGAALLGALAAPLLTPTAAQAWWRGGWGWHGGWGWRGGVVVGVPPIVVGAPVYAPAPYPYPYAAPYHWIVPHYAPNGAFVPGHWGY